MAERDALAGQTESVRTKGGSALRGRQGGAAQGAPHGSNNRTLPGNWADTKRLVDPGEVPEGGPTVAAATRDALYRRLLAAADVLSAAFAFTIAIPVLGEDALGALAVVAIVMVIPICKLSGLYDRDEHLLRKTTLDEAPVLFRVAALYTLLAFLAGEAIVDGAKFGSEQALTLWGLLLVSMVAIRTTARRIAGAVAPEERCVILGSAEAAHWLSSKLERSHAAHIRVVGRVPLSPLDQSTNELPLLGGFETLGLLLAEHDIDRAVLAPGMADGDHMLDAIRVVKSLGVRVSVLPRMFEVVGAAVEFDDVEGATLLGIRRHGLSRSSRLVKRAFDIAGATLGLIVIAPLLAMIALAVKLDTPGPVFFKQRRVGRNDRVFEMFKFRTMVDGADRDRARLEHRNEAEGGLFKIEDDPRITRVGRFLRRSSLDELPQLLNVVRGDMALVGPRPLVVDEDRMIEGWNRRRMMLPPGMTGLWQVFGSARIPMSEMVKIDYLYGANWSLWMDVKILLRTIPFVLGRRGL